MKREADYKSMYMEMLCGAEDAIRALSSYEKNGPHDSIIEALRTLINAERTSEDIYISSTSDNMIYLKQPETGTTASK